MSDFAIRPMTKTDEPFVFRAWLEGFWPSFAGNIAMPKSDYLRAWHVVIERILADPSTQTKVAHVEGQPDSLLGFACAERRWLHWCYVKQPFRGLGVARELIASLHLPMPGVCSHWSIELTKREGNGQDWKHNPTLLKEYGG